MKIEEQDLPETSPGFIYNTPEKSTAVVANSFLLGFEKMFQQSMHDESSAAACKRVTGQGSDPFQTNKRARVEFLPPNVNGHDEQQCDWQYDFNRTIASLNAKHGAIDKDCKLSSNWMTRLNLFGIWGLIKQLEKKKLDELDITSLSPYYNIVRDAKNMNFNVNWLHERLDDIRVAVVARHEARRLEASKNQHVKEKKKKEAKLRWLQVQAKELEDQVTAADLEIEHLNQEINNETGKFQCYETHPLLDGLI